MHLRTIYFLAISHWVVHGVAQVHPSCRETRPRRGRLQRSLLALFLGKRHWILCCIVAAPPSSFQQFKVCRSVKLIQDIMASPQSVIHPNPPATGAEGVAPNMNLRDARSDQLAATRYWDVLLCVDECPRAATECIRRLSSKFTRSLPGLKDM